MADRVYANETAPTESYPLSSAKPDSALDRAGTLAERIERLAAKIGRL